MNDFNNYIIFILKIVCTQNIIQKIKYMYEN